MVTPTVKREAVAHLQEAHEMSERRACRTIGCDRMTARYRSRRPDDPLLRERLLALAKERRRFGYRRLLIFLRVEFFAQRGGFHPGVEHLEPFARDQGEHRRTGLLHPFPVAAQLLREPAPHLG